MIGPAKTGPAGTGPTNQQPVVSQPRQPLWWAEFWLVMLTVASVLVTRRLFDSWDYLFPMLLLGVGNHLLLIEMRRQRWPLVPVIPMTAVVSFLIIIRLLYEETLFGLVLPTASTFSQLRSDLSDAWFEFGFVEAPTAATNGFVFAAGVAVWLMALLADNFAFKESRPLAATAPAFVLMVFVGALTADGWAALSAGVVIFCAVLFAVTHRLTYSSTPWLRGGSSPKRQAREPVRLSIGLVAAAALGAVLLTPILPGAQGSALIELKELDGSSRPARVAISPLVDARGRLLTTSSAELFRVEASEPSYWRISGLGTFDGAVWGSDRTYSDASGNLRSIGDSEDLLEQTITIGALDSVWLPAAFEPARFIGRDALYDPETAALVVRGGIELADGFSYVVTSSIGLPTVDELLSAGDEVPPEIADSYMALPEDFSPAISALAERAAEGATTPFAKALALQNFFLDNFTYSLTASTGHDTERLLTFLLEERSGYCEQFAGSYAAMARAIGLPSRVAVGFTPGELVDGTYVVRGEHYHAWPEVWIDGRWVYFEPTPGRGAPRASVYTGVESQQVAPGDPSGAEVFSEDDPSFGTSDEDLAGSQDLLGFIDPVQVGTADGPSDTFRNVVLLVLIVLLGLGTVWAIAVPAVRRLRSWQRRSRASGNRRAEVHSSWEDLCEALQRAGTLRRQGESHSEFAKRAARRCRLDAGSIGAAAAAMDEACFAPYEPTPGEVEALTRRVRNLRRSVFEQHSAWERIKSTYRPKIKSER